MLPCIDAREIVSSEIAVRLDRLVECDGHAPTEDLDLLCRLVVAFKPASIFEFGTFRGLTTYNLAKHAPDGCTVYTLDLPRELIRSAALPFDGREQRYCEKDKSGDLYKGTPEEKNIVQIFGDSATFDFSPFFGKIDFIFIDASHAYENVLSDSLRAATMRSERGIIAWHDYGAWPGVTRALNDLHQSSAIFSGLRHIAGTSVAVLMMD